ncbi:MAG: hypothetical protein Q8O82_19450 [Pseudorhodobacter sp.]|nr:hypothetical protein [Pseudorhodobacter sp.]
MFQSVQEVRDDPEVTEAERALIDACRAGEDCILNDGTLPPEGSTDPAHSVRAEVIRLLAQGGTPACGLHEVGVILFGAVITGTLDLRFAKCRGRLALDNCRFAAKPQMDQARLPELSLQGSHLPGLFAQGARVTGSVFLRGVTATGTVEVNSAQIGGQLSCIGATLNGDKGMALNAQGAQVAGHVFLRRVTATGTVDVNSAQIGGQLDCDGARLNGDGGKALNAQGARVEQAFMFRAVAAVSGRVDLSAANVGDLSDDAASWDKCAEIILDGFTYDRIIGTAAPKSYATRRDWLAKGARVAGEFSPHPYTQFAKAMRAAGHAAEARRALMERDRLLFAEADKADRAAARAAWHSKARRGNSGRIWLRAFGRRLWSGLSRRVVGYGHRPEYALFWALAATLVGMVWYFIAWRAGVMVPNSAVILTSPDWLAAMQAAENAPALTWVKMPPGQHYETFYALPYALDVFVPLVSLGEDQAWAASTATWLGWVTRWVGFGFQIMGWVVTSLGLAAITGFVQRHAPD